MERTCPPEKLTRCILEISPSCNLRCRTCTRWHKDRPESAPPKAQPLSYDELTDIQRQLAGIRLKHVSYLGGEPFLFPRILDIAAHAKRQGLGTAVVTNGTLIDENRLQRIVDERLFDSIVFSIDGPEDIHDQIRGMAGAFRKVSETAALLQRIKKLKKRKRPKFLMYVTVSSLNCLVLRKTFEAARRLDANAVRFISASCVSESIMKDSNLALGSTSVTHHSYAVGDDMQIPKNMFPRIKEDLQEISHQAQKAGIKFQAEALLLGGPAPASCAFLGKELIISPYGDVYACPMLPRRILGNLRFQTLLELTQHSCFDEEINRIRTMAEGKKLPICRQC